MTMIRMVHPDHGAMHAHDKGEVERLQSHGWRVDEKDLEKTKIDGAFPSEIQAAIEAKRLERERRLALEGPTVPAAPRHFELAQAKVASEERERVALAKREADAKILADKIAKGEKPEIVRPEPVKAPEPPVVEMKPEEVKPPKVIPPAKRRGRPPKSSKKKS